MSSVFDSYARYYDLLYRDKDYAAEAEYVAMHINEHSPKTKNILELGCGTGGHAEHLARMGYSVHGVDMSAEMLGRAEARKARLPAEVAARMSFSLGDVRSVRTNHTYDAVISLFHVMSYQVSNEDLVAMHDTASIHLSKGGLFLFDYWYGPAVLTQIPEVRIKRLEDDAIRALRIAEPVMHLNENVVDVNYTVFIEQKATRLIESITEKHRMRYLFLPELKCYGTANFNAGGSYAWMTQDEPKSEIWGGLQLLVRN